MNRGPADPSSRFAAAEVFTDADLARIAEAMARGDEQDADRLRARPSGEPVLLAIEPAGPAAGLTARGTDAAGPVIVGLECPECGEDAVEQASDTLVPYDAHGMAEPRYAHPDGEPLCPVMGPRGYEPAQPLEVVQDEPNERGDDPLQSARTAVDAALNAPANAPVGHSRWSSQDEVADDSSADSSDAPGQVRS